MEIRNHDLRSQNSVKAAILIKPTGTVLSHFCPTKQKRSVSHSAGSREPRHGSVMRFVVVQTNDGRHDRDLVHRPQTSGCRDVAGHDG